MILQAGGMYARLLAGLIRQQHPFLEMFDQVYRAADRMHRGIRKRCAFGQARVLIKRLRETG